MRLIDVDALVDALMTYTWRDEDERLIDDADEKREYIKQWLPDLPTVSGWVSVKDRLPEDGTSILGHMAWGSMVTICYDHGFLSAERTVLADGAVTYWMPLPEPPKEVSVDG